MINRIAKLLGREIDDSIFDLEKIVREYVAARDALEEATRKPNSHAPHRQLMHGSPIKTRYYTARHALTEVLK